jgi:16S rRNA (cytidine1402-2'-O)-methyltransferase
LIKETLGSLSDFNYSLIFFISPKKINKCIPYIKHYFKGRKILICREISKFYEEYLRFNVDQLNLFTKDLKGELTVVLSEKLDKKKLLILNESDKRIIDKIINKLSTKEIAELIGQTSKVPKKEIYNYCIKLKNEK